MKKVLHSAKSRGAADFGWLNARYSFSFANFFDATRTQFGMLRVLNDDTVGSGMGFGTHPHDNMEIITIPQKGSLKHKDSLGNEGIITSGEIQVMSAGTGVEHSEVNASKTEPISLFQIWIFPETRNVKPRYDQKNVSLSLLPNQLNLIVRPKDIAVNEELWIHQQAYLSLGKFSEAKEITYNLHSENHGVYIFVIKGNLSVDNDILTDRDALGIWDSMHVDLMLSEDSEILLIEVPMR